MREKTNIDIEAIQFLYKKYKEYFIPCIIIITCVFLFFIVIISQIQDLINIGKQREIEFKKLELLNKNLNILTSINSAELDSQFDSISSALPPNKDFEGIIVGVSSAAQRAGVSLSDFAFQVGDLTEAPVVSSGYPFLATKLSIQSSYQQSANFITELFKSFPLTEIINVSLSGRAAELSVIFYYKPMPQIEVDNFKPIKTLTKENLALINELSSWKSNSIINIPIPSTSSGSRSPF